MKLLLPSGSLLLLFVSRLFGCTESFSLQPALSAVNAAFEYNPYAAGAIVAGFKAGTADILAQKRQIRKTIEAAEKALVGATSTGSAAAAATTAATITLDNQNENDDTTMSIRLDAKRTLSFLLYGAIYQGFAQEFTYNHLYPVLFGTDTSALTVLKKVFCDMCVQTPLLTLPIAYYSKALLAKNSFRDAMGHYFDDVMHRGLLFKFWGLWTPVQCLTFSVIPEHFRVSFIALVSFFWVIILSSLSASREMEEASVPASVASDSTSTSTSTTRVN